MGSRFYLQLGLGCWAMAVLLGGSLQAATKHERTRLAEELTREALNREAYGLTDERESLLKQAACLVEDYKPARWHQGMVLYQKEWIPAVDLPQRLQDDPRVVAYREVRDRYGETAEDQLALANWCRQRHLQEREQAHLTHLLELDPDHTEARERLGFRRVGFNWVAEDQLRQGDLQQREQTQLIEQWRPRIERLAKQLKRVNPQQRLHAEEQLLAITDVDAVWAIESVLARDSEELAVLMVRSLGGIPGYESSLILARQALYSPFAKVRQQSAIKLQSRRQDSYVPALLATMQTPTTSSTAVFRSMDGRLLLRRMLGHETQDQRETLVLDTVLRRVARPGGDGLETTQRAAMEMRLRETQRDWLLREQNRRRLLHNELVSSVLNIATDQNLPPMPEAWWDWWDEVNEVYREGEKPTNEVRLTEEIAYIDRAPEPTFGGSEGGESSSGAPQTRSDCLAAGTPVWTDRGPVAIEQVRVGDLVLSQDPETGEIAYQPVLRTTVRPEGPLLRVQVDDLEAFETSGGHLFWCAGEGWMKSRHLESGMELHGVQGTSRVSVVDAGTDAETYNLVVAKFHTYFVGEGLVLCHDNTPARATNASVPGLLPN